ncbi:MAG: NAD-dependent epimerase/dehydratase family protein, partial [Actinobacteria bacterium]|nr:NAD-dependent epimerase/dehydratase family protein [Actinomycetota bacterium]
MRALITGGAGFIGSHLVDALVARGDECTVLDDLSRGSRDNLLHHADRVTLVEGSVTDQDLVEDLAPDFDAIYHLASVVGVKSTIADPARVIEVAVTGTANLLRAAAPDASFLVASSSEIYGRSVATPFDEQTPGLLGPPQAARWSYAHAKACMEHLALASGSTARRPASVIRYFNVFGPRMPRLVDPSVVSLFFDAVQADRDLTIYGDGSQTRSFVFVQDAVDGTVAASERGSGQVVNLGGPQETTIADLGQQILNISGSTSALNTVALPATLGLTSEEPLRRSAT